MIIVAITLIVALMMNFNYQPEPVIKKTPVKKVVVVKKVYIKVPAPADSTHVSDSTAITLPKQPLRTPAPDFKKYRRSKNFHKNVFIS